MKKAVAGIGLADDYVMEVLIWQDKLVSYIVNCALFEDVSANEAVPVPVPVPVPMPVL